MKFILLSKYRAFIFQKLVVKFDQEKEQAFKVYKTFKFELFWKN